MSGVEAAGGKQTVTQLRLNGGALMSFDVRDASHADINTLIWLNEVVQSLHAALYPDAFKRLADPPAARAFFAERLAETQRAR